MSVVDGVSRRRRLEIPLSPGPRRADTGWAIQQARAAIRLLVSAHGASSFAEPSPLQRIWRDSEITSRHAVITPTISAEVYGRSLLGIADGVTALV